MTQPKALSEVVFYYPGHLWDSGDWVKTMLLFFDGVGLLVPEYKQNQLDQYYPELAGPLREKGLLHYLLAEKVVDKEATQQLSKAIGALLASGAFDSLSKDGTAFHEISMSRIGYFGEEKLADDLVKELKRRGLARGSQDGVSIPVHPLVRYLILTLLAQILKPKGKERGLHLLPATDQVNVVRALTEFLNLPKVASAGHVVAFDLQSVSVDLSAVPIDELLAFRAQHHQEHRNYARMVRKFARELSLMEPTERDIAFAERQSELDDLASDLRKRGRKIWRAPASFALGLTGASWTYTTGDIMGAVLGAGAILVGGLNTPENEAGAYSYLFSANKKFA